jgi:uncharacterized protein (TIGR02117 family)
MSKLLKWMWSVFFALVFLYLTVLSIDVYRMQKYDPLGSARLYTVRVFAYAWHSGIVLDRNDIPRAYQPYFSLFARHRWVEISWGDEAFYRNQNDTLAWPLGISAIVWPTKSVLHVVGYDMPPHAIYGVARVQKIPVGARAFRGLLKFVTSYFVSDSATPYAIVERGLYGDSWFLKSKGKYVFPFTCNAWTAQALKEAGLPLTPVLYQIPGILMEVLRQRPLVEKNMKFVRLY